MQLLPMCHGPRARFLAGLIFSLTLAACGGNSDTPSRLDNIGDGGDGSTDIPGGDDSNDPAQLGRGSAENFVAGEIEVGIGDNALSPGGDTSLSVTLVNGEGELVTSTVNVTFNSECIADGSSQLVGTDTEGGNSVSTNNGRATVTYRANGCVGEDQVTARATFQGVEAGSARATITVEADTVQTLEFVEVEPELISIRGTGGNETARVTFRVLGSTGAPIEGIPVNFRLSTTIGGLSLVDDQTQVLSNDNGEASTTVQAGTVATSVRVIASTAEVSNEPASSRLVVSTGIPDQNSASVSATNLFPVAFFFDGVESQITMRLADAFNNPPPDGTAVSFTTSGGSIDASCTTQNGACSVTWRSQSPRPIPDQGFTVDEGSLSVVCPTSDECRPGRVKVLATAIGNESFGDENGNGLYDGTDDTFNASTGSVQCNRAVPQSTASVGANGCDDLGEAYLDSNFNGTRQTNGLEPFVDFNQNGEFDQGNGIYDGVLCSNPRDPSDTTTPQPGECTRNSVSVRDDLLLVMVCEDPLVMGDGRLPGQESLSLGLGETGTVTMLLADCNGNGMAPGTTVDLNTNNLENAQADTNLDGALAGSANPTLLQVIVTADDTDPASGVIFMNITSPTPGGSKTVTPAGIGVSSQ